MSFSAVPRVIVDEGDDCHIEGCAGFYELHRIGDCRCHISPPCNACVEAPLVCSACGHDPANEEREGPYR